jgi:hypothetical protein
MHHAAADKDHFLILFSKHMIRAISVACDITFEVLIKFPQVISAAGEFITEKDNWMAVQQFACDVDPNIAFRAGSPVIIDYPECCLITLMTRDFEHQALKIIIDRPEKVK